MQIDNITVRDYFGKTDTTLLDSIYPYVPKKNEFNKKVCDFDKLTFDEVSSLKILIRKDSTYSLINTYSLIKIWKILYNTYFLNGLIIDFFQSKKWLEQKLKEVYEREQKMLFSVTDEKLKIAGIDNLNKFGVFNTKIQLAEQFHTLPNAVGKWLYTDVLLIQAYNLTRSNINKELNK